MPNKKHNSVETTQSDIIKNQSLIIEILTKIDQAINSSDSYVTVNGIDKNGNEITTQIPSISYLNTRVEQMFSAMKKISGFDGYPSTMYFDQNGKKMFAIDINEEPEKLNGFSEISTFKATPNWIFDSFLNPLISIELDLTDKIGPNTKTVISKRFIIKFDSMEQIDESGYRTEILTTAGRQKLEEFNELYNGKSNINLDDFLAWTQTTGVQNRVNEFLIDEDQFDIEPLNIHYKGYFTIQGTDIDTTHNKLWYIFDTLDYRDLANDSIIELKPGVDLAVNNPNGTSATVYKVAEISTITSQFRVRLERIFGEEPVPIMQNGLRIHSTAIPEKKVRISVGYDEYSVLFVKPLNSISHIQAVDWSPGMGFYTNELRKDDASGTLLKDYYINKVLDYGLALDELTEKKIPTHYGVKPDAPVLIEENFTVVQTNQHLTNTVEAERIRDLHNNKVNLTSEIQQIQNTIEKQNAMITKMSFTSEAEKKSAQQRVKKLNTDLVNITKSKNSVTAEILQNKKNINKIKPTYSLRGIFPFPKAKISEHSKPQEVVQFEIWYRKLSKSGDENELKTFKDISKQQTSNKSNKDLTFQDIERLNTSKNVNATFSNWNKIKTDARIQVFNSETGEYEWEIQDVSDSNTPTINQVDIPVEVGETIELKIRSVSEVGYPEAPLMSNFSETLTIPFPENLETIINDDDFILSDAMGDNIKSEVMKELESLGVNQHISSQIRDVDVYYPHTANAIASGFKDENGRIINVYDYLLKLRNELTALKEEVNRSKGILEIYMISSNSKQRIFNTNNVTFNVQLEDYLTATEIGLVDNPISGVARTYKNEIIKIDTYTLQIKNNAESALLGLLASRGYGSPTGLQSTDFAYNADLTSSDEHEKQCFQPMYVSPSDEPLIEPISLTGNMGSYTQTYDTTPVMATQKHNSFIWQYFRAVEGHPLCYKGISLGNDGSNFEPVIDFNDDVTGKEFQVPLLAVTSEKQNMGAPGNPDVNTVVDITTATNIVTSGSIVIPYEQNFVFITNSTEANISDPKRNMGTTIHATVSTIDSITSDTQENMYYLSAGEENAFNIPIAIYAKPFTGSENKTGTTTTFETLLDHTISTSVQPANIDKDGDNYIMITHAGLATALTASGNFHENHKIMLDGITSSTPSIADSINKKLFKIKSISGNVITLDKKTSIALGSNTIIAQIHICNVNTDVNGSKPMRTYNVVNNPNGYDSVVDSYVEIPSNSKPAQHTKSLRFYLEDENTVRPISFQVNWKITQHKRAMYATTHTGIGGGYYPGVGGIMTGG